MCTHKLLIYKLEGQRKWTVNTNLFSGYIRKKMHELYNEQHNYYQLMGPHVDDPFPIQLNNKHSNETKCQIEQSTTH